MTGIILVFIAAVLTKVVILTLSKRSQAERDAQFKKIMVALEEKAKSNGRLNASYYDNLEQKEK